jgi:hypothetical protein
VELSVADATPRRPTNNAMPILLRALSACLGLSSLTLASCQTSGTKVTFASPVAVPQGRVVGYIDPDTVFHPHPQPTSVDLYFQPSDGTRPKRVRLTATQPAHGMSLVSIGHHSYTVPMEFGGGPPPPGRFSGGVGVVTHDVILEVQDRQPRYLVFRDRGTMWVDSLPPPFYYSFSGRPDLQYSILPGCTMAPSPTKKL